MSVALSMSEGAAIVENDEMNVSKSEEQLSAGAMIRQAREAAGLHIAALAVALKVPVKKLEALECDRLDLLPDAVFARALAASVCRALKLDSALVLERLPLTSAPRLQPLGDSINMPFRAPGEGSHNSVWDRLSKPVVLAVLALLVAALVVIFFPSTKSPAELPATPADMKISEPVPVAKSSPDAAALTSQVMVGVPSGTTMAVPEARVPGNVPALSALAVASAPASMAASSSIIPGAVHGDAGSIVVLKARGASWIEVTDGKGIVQVRKTLAAGDVYRVSGSLPLSVVVGRADNMDIQVRGKDFDLTRLAKDNVARFEVK
jgi:cytoskeleton protein RodZ